MSKFKTKQATNTYIAYTLLQRQTVTSPASSAPQVVLEITRYRRSNGDFVEIRTKDGEEVYLAFSYQGKFLRRDPQKDYLIEVSKFIPGLLESKSEKAMLSSRQIRKEEPTVMIEATKCYVLREEKDGALRETYLAPSLGTILKMTYTNKNVGASVNLDTISLTYGEPVNDIFDNLPVNLPIKSIEEVRSHKVN